MLAMSGRVCSHKKCYQFCIHDISKLYSVSCWFSDNGGSEYEVRHQVRAGWQEALMLCYLACTIRLAFVIA